MLTLLGLILYRVANGNWREAEENIGGLAAALLLYALLIGFAMGWVRQ